MEMDSVDGKLALLQWLVIYNVSIMGFFLTVW